MRRLLFFFLILFVTASCRKDRLHWSSAVRLESGTTHRLNNILFTGDSMGYVCGGDRFFEGDLSITHDGGRTWALHTFPEYDKEMFGMTASRSGRVYVIGFDGKLISSRDAFATYEFRQMQEYLVMKTIACKADDGLVYAGGISFTDGYIARRDSNGNGGSLENVKYELNRLKLLPSGKGYMAGYGVVLKTADEGLTWAVTDAHTDNFTGLDVHGDDTVYTCGTGGSIYKTTNGGGSWSRLRNGDDISLPRYQLQSLLMLNAAEGYCVGDKGLVIYTDDGGAHWSEVDNFTGEDLYDIAKMPGGDLLVCGSGGALYRLHR